MTKQIITYCFFIFILGCGFKPVYNDINNRSIIIKQINYTGSNELNYLIQGNLNLKTEPKSKGLILNITTSENQIAVTKNTRGINTEKLFSITIKINIKDYSNTKNLLTDTFVLTERYTLTDNLDNDNLTRDIIKEKLIQNSINKIRYQLFLTSKQNEL